MKMEREAMIRKGPWTEQEDFKLVSYVSLFGDRRWDFIAKVSGLNRSGKSCRLRWVNYLHPGLKRGKLTHQEERLVLELQSKWGNRWSRIARKLPGRTDNEIKNYWRILMRKKAQDQKKQASPPKSIVSPASDPTAESGVESYFDTGGVLAGKAAFDGGKEQEDGEQSEYSLEDIWKDIAEEGCEFSNPPSMASPSWDYECSSEPLWMTEEEERKMSKMALPSKPSHDPILSCFEFEDSLS